MAKDTVWIYGSDKIAINFRREPFEIAFVFSNENRTLDYNSIVKEISRIVSPESSPSLEGVIATIELQDHKIVVEQQSNGIEVKMIYTGNISDDASIPQRLFEVYQRIKTSLPKAFDYSRFESRFREDFGVKKETQDRKELIVSGQSYIERLDLHIKEQIRILSEGMGKEVGYILTRTEFNCLVEELNTLSSRALTSTNLKQAMRLVGLVKRGVEIIEEYSFENEGKPEFVQEARQKITVLEETVYARRGEGLDEPFIASHTTPMPPPPKTPRHELTEEERKLREQAGLEGQLTRAITAQNYERAGKISQRLKRLNKNDDDKK